MFPFGGVYMHMVFNVTVAFLRWKELDYFVKWYKKSKNPKTKLRLLKHAKKLVENNRNYSVK